MIHHHCIAELHDDEDELTLWFELADDRTIALTYPKNGDSPHVSFSHGCGDADDFDYYFQTPEEFEDWVKIALNALMLRPSSIRTASGAGSVKSAKSGADLDRCCPTKSGPP